MITLEEYKNHLLTYYRAEIDNNPQKMDNRKQILERLYNDDKLIKIINNTLDFIKDILNSDTLNYNYCKIPLEEDTTTYIFLDLTGGYFSDVLYKDQLGRTISRYIMKKIFGSNFYIDIIEEEIEYLTEDEDIGSFYYNYYLYMQGFPKDIPSIRKQFLGRSKILKNNN